MVFGAVAGLVASYAMTRFHVALSGRGLTDAEEPQSKKPVDAEGDDATMEVAERVSESATGSELTQTEKKEVGGPAVHYAFGIGSGIFYGAIRELWPNSTLASGGPFGAVVWVAADQLALPLSGLGPWPLKAYPAATNLQHLVSHLVYGLTAETVYGALEAVAGGRQVSGSRLQASAGPRAQIQASGPRPQAPGSRLQQALGARPQASGSRLHQAPGPRPQASAGPRPQTPDGPRLHQGPGLRLQASPGLRTGPRLRAPGLRPQGHVSRSPPPLLPHPAPQPLYRFYRTCAPHRTQRTCRTRRTRRTCCTCCTCYTSHPCTAPHPAHLPHSSHLCTCSANLLDTNLFIDIR